MKNFRLILFGLGLGLPKLALACPLCFSLSPHYRGLVLATLFLLPIPFLLAALLWWMLREPKKE